MQSKLITAPTVEPVTKAEVKAHAKIEAALTEEDAYIDGLIAAARRYCEEYTGLAFLTQTWAVKRDNFCDKMVIPRAPLLTVEQVAYIDGDGGTVTLGNTAYTVDNFSRPGRVLLAYGQSWPVTRNYEHAVTITFKAGFGDTADKVPQDLRHAVTMLAAHWYEERTPVAYGNSLPREVPFTVTNILDNYRQMGV